jgi:hypothetical protein
MRTLLAAVIVAGLSLAGCKGTLGAGSGTDATATGIWSGTDSASGLGVTAYVDASERATFIRDDGVQFVGTLQISGDTLSATLQGYSGFGGAFGDGSTYGAGSLNGTVTTGTTLSATLNFTTQGGSPIAGTWSLSFNTLSNSGASLGAISANYTDTVTGTVISIAGNGVMTGQNGANGCVLNGAVSISNARYDVYEVAYNYQNCTGTYAALNGVQFTGLAALNAALVPVQLTMAVAGASSAGKYGIVSILTGG